MSGTATIVRRPRSRDNDDDDDGNDDYTNTRLPTSASVSLGGSSAGSVSTVSTMPLTEKLSEIRYLRNNEWMSKRPSSLAASGARIAGDALVASAGYVGRKYFTPKALTNMRMRRLGIEHLDRVDEAERGAREWRERARDDARTEDLRRGKMRVDTIRRIDRTNQTSGIMKDMRDEEVKKERKRLIREFISRREREESLRDERVKAEETMKVAKEEREEVERRMDAIKRWTKMAEEDVEKTKKFEKGAEERWRKVDQDKRGAGEMLRLSVMAQIPEREDCEGARAPRDRVDDRVVEVAEKDATNEPPNFSGSVERDDNLAMKRDGDSPGEGWDQIRSENSSLRNYSNRMFSSEPGAIVPYPADGTERRSKVGQERKRVVEVQQYIDPTIRPLVHEDTGNELKVKEKGLSDEVEDPSGRRPVYRTVFRSSVENPQDGGAGGGCGDDEDDGCQPPPAIRLFFRTMCTDQELMR